MKNWPTTFALVLLSFSDTHAHLLNNGSISAKRFVPVESPTETTFLSTRKKVFLPFLPCKMSIFSPLLNHMRGGTSTPSNPAVLPTTRPGVVQIPSNNIKRVAIYVTTTIVATHLIYSNRSILAKLFDKTYLQYTVLELLQSTKQHGSFGIIIYILGMALWETIGISTIPVETAAGMAFGWIAILASTAGKLLGASIAFAMGRGLLSDMVQTKFADNEILLLVRHAVKQHPLRTALLMKYSCFPGTIKNFGSSLFSEIQYWMFALATVVHGGPFTCVWTWLGIDTAKRLAALDGIVPVNQGLQLALAVCMVVGLVLCPMLMAWWIRDMKRMSASYQHSKIAIGTRRNRIHSNSFHSSP